MHVFNQAVAQQKIATGGSDSWNHLYQWKSMAYQPALKSIKSERRRDRIARNLERANKEVNIYLI